MATPRYKLVDDQEACDYHLVSRCVRRAWLCGRDPLTGRDYSHRRRWLVDRILGLARCFSVDIHAWAVMSNHFHVVVHYDPKACETWTDEEVARRWIEAFPPTHQGVVLEKRKAEAIELLLGDAARLARARHTLGSLSFYMKHVKQPVARRANQEDDCQGHFFEQRFHSGALLGEEAVLAAMAYVDLNPVRAGLAKRLAECHDSSISERVRTNDSAELAKYLRPVSAGPKAPDENIRPCARATLAFYIALLTGMLEPGPPHSGLEDEPVWRRRVRSLRPLQRAHGPPGALKRWATKRGFQQREKALPD